MATPETPDPNLHRKIAGMEKIKLGRNELSFYQEMMPNLIKNVYAMARDQIQKAPDFVLTDVRVEYDGLDFIHNAATVQLIFRHKDYKKEQVPVCKNQHLLT